MYGAAGPGQLVTLSEAQHTSHLQLWQVNVGSTHFERQWMPSFKNGHYLQAQLQTSCIDGSGISQRLFCCVGCTSLSLFSLPVANAISEAAILVSDEVGAYTTAESWTFRWNGNRSQYAGGISVLFAVGVLLGCGTA